MAFNGERHGLHPPIEQYLETVFYLEEEGAMAIQARLAERLGHSAPTVSEMVHRLQEEGYIEIEGRSINMTSLGRQVATSVIRKHRLAERLLTDVIGLPWHKVHDEADRWEHVISDDVEQRLVEVLGNPATCPHGNPIPGSGHRVDPGAPLADARRGERVKLCRVSEQVELDRDTLVYLERHRFLPGSEATVVGRGPDGTLALEVLEALGVPEALGAPGPDGSGGSSGPQGTSAEMVELGPALSRLLFYTHAERAGTSAESGSRRAKTSGAAALPQREEAGAGVGALGIAGIGPAR